MRDKDALASSGTKVAPYDSLPRRMKVGGWLVQNQHSVRIADKRLCENQGLFNSRACKSQRPRPGW